MSDSRRKLQGEMMGTYIYALHSVSQSDTVRVGGKAASLVTLLNAGFPVPGGLCIRTDAFHLALAPFEQKIVAILDQVDLYDLHTAKGAAEQISAILADLLVPLAVLEELMPAVTKWEDGNLQEFRCFWAVRSSATAEDQAGASYAGQYDTVLGVCGEAEIQAAILTCWRSFFSESALAERSKKGGLGVQEGMAVLMQPMVNAECAGVAFSVDPVAKNRKRVLINAGWGQGLGVVDGTVATDTVWVERQECDVDEQQIVLKSKRFTLDDRWQPHLTPVPEEMQQAACLPNEWSARIAQFAIAAELLMGTAQDVEWAIADEQVWILQSRPITALSPDVAQARPFPLSWEVDEDRTYFWTRHNNEGWPEVMTPLELDHIASLDGIWEEASRAMGVEYNLKLIYCNGRVYDRRPPIDWTPAERTIRRAAYTDLGKRLHQEGRTAWDHWGPEVVKATERLRDFNSGDNIGDADGPALATHLEEVMAVFRRHWGLHGCMKFTPPESFFDTFAAIAGFPQDESKKSDIEDAAYHLLDSGDTPLTQLIDGLYELACIARQEPLIVTLLTEMPTDIMAQLATMDEAATLLAALDSLLDVYGERIGHGYGSSATLKLPTWREQPRIVLAMLLPYMAPTVEAPATARQRRQQAIKTKIDALCTQCDDQALVAGFRKELAYAQKTFSILETHNHYMDQMFYGQLRHAVMGAACWLVGQDLLDSADDVFWLRFGEITAALRADKPTHLGTLIEARRAEFNAWSEMEAPPFLGMPESLLSKRPPLQNALTPVEPDDPNCLRGQGASPGQYRGRVRVMQSVQALPTLSPGDILVAWNVGPLWTPIFPILGGLILESGAVGQHAAATAREYGIPAIVNVKKATSHIPNGTWVTMDGTVGLVELEK